MQPDIHQPEPETQGVPIEDYRGPLLVHRGVSKIVQLARVSELERPSSYAAAQPASLGLTIRYWWRIIYHSDDTALRFIQRGTACLLVNAALAISIWVAISLSPHIDPPGYEVFAAVFYPGIFVLVAGVIYYVKAGWHSRNSIKPTFSLIASVVGVAACWCVLLTMMKAIDWLFGD
jgi:hypothetical protein